MVDIFALALPHALLMIALWRVVLRDDLDHEGESDGENAVPGSATGRRERVSREMRLHD